MKKITVKNKNGFTIIEIVLVLAIAGLIFLMVFLALPALQRSQRNQLYKNNLSLVISALQNYRSNNGGRRIPATGNDGYYPGKVSATDVGMRNHPLRSYFDAIDFTADINSVKVFENNGDVSFSKFWWGKPSRIIVFLDKTCPDDGSTFRTATLKHTPGKTAALVLLESGDDSKSIGTRDAQIYCQDF
jgi:prepilin-type N-terminal cleavage/methylation domain-containing protein